MNERLALVSKSVSKRLSRMLEGEMPAASKWRWPGSGLDGMGADSRPKASGCNRTWVAGDE